MSEFDEEAEREKLRKEFAEDEQDRAETERMSELLLGGATMTNKHCESCGSPLFRRDGRTFCSNCGDDFRAASSGPVETQSTPESAETVDSGAEAAPSPGRDPATNPSVSGPTSGAAPAPATGDADLDEARASLVRTVTALARRAENAENPGHARDLLSAAHEAAETLEAIDRVRGNR